MPLRLRTDGRDRLPGTGRRFTEIDPGTDGYPWTCLALNPINFPTPGMFWDWNGPFWTDGVPSIDDVVRGYLGSALIMAGEDPELASSRSSRARRLRQQARALVLSSPWNLALYGCQNANYCGGCDPEMPSASERPCNSDLHVIGDQGYGIHAFPYHDDVRRAIELGRPPTRMIDMMGQRLPGIVGRRMPLLYLPPVDLEALRGSAPEARCTHRWEDGSSCLLPPPPVQRLGVRNPYALPGTPTWLEIFGDGGR